MVFTTVFTHTRQFGYFLMFSAAGALAPAWAQAPKSDAAPEKNWQATLSTDTKYMNWVSTYGYPAPKVGNTQGKGSQVYSSLGIQLVGRLNDDTKLSIMLRSGAIGSRQQTATFTNSYTGFTDTTVGSTLTYYGFDGFQPFVSLNTNLPTGAGTSSGFKSKMDPDISKIPNYGEGWNLGATTGVTVPITKALVATFSGGYTYRGPYRSDGTLGNLNPDTLNPGDVLSFTSSLTWKEGGFNAQLSATFTTESRATLAGTDYFRSGDKFQLNGSLGYKWNDAWSSKLGAAWTRIQRNEIYVTPPPGVNAEPFNSNGDVFSVDLSTSYKTGAFTLTPSASLLYRNRNAYDPVTFNFVPAKVTGSLGLGAAYAVTNAASLTASLGHTWVNENPRPNPVTPRILTRVWMMSLGGSVKF